MDAFDQIIGQVILNEVGHNPANPGGYVCDPLDPGGETKYGISRQSYPQLDIKSLTLDQAKGIYRTDFYNLMNLQSLDSASVQYYVLDMGVNSGQRKAVETLQGAVHLTQDGILGPATAQAVNACDEHGLVDRLIELRMLAYVSDVMRTPSELKFLHDWTVRAFITL